MYMYMCVHTCWKMLPLLIPTVSSFMQLRNCHVHKSGNAVSCHDVCSCLLSSPDIDECESSPCVNGDCQHTASGYECDCQPGWTGTHCDVGT